MVSEKVESLGNMNTIFYMISMRVLPGSPNFIYNVILPHIDSLSLFSVLMGVAVGQAPFNYFMAKAGQILMEIKEKGDIMDRETYYQFVAIALFFLVPPIASKLCKEAKPQNNSKLN